MNIILPSIEYRNISIPHYQETPSENELILFFEDNNLIAVMNETTTCIWKFIVDSYKENSSNNITTNAILEHLYKSFNMESQNDDDTINDIVDILNEFINKRMIGDINDLL